MILNILNNLIDKSITQVSAGEPCGSIIILTIGTEEYTLFIDCAWRLSRGLNVLASWRDDNNPKNGNLTKQIKALKGLEIKEISLSNLYDLKIIFYNGKTLDAFTDITNKGYPDESIEENWTLGDIKNNVAYSINNKYKLVSSKYSGLSI